MRPPSLGDRLDRARHHRLGGGLALDEPQSQQGSRAAEATYPPSSRPDKGALRAVARANGTGHHCLTQTGQPMFDFA